MKKKVRNILITIVAAAIGIVVWKFNVYDTQFYSVFFWSGKVHTPAKLEEVVYTSQLSMEAEGTYTFAEEEELAMWDDFVTCLNDTILLKVRGTWGRSYTGEGVFLKFKGIEKEFWVIVKPNGESIRFGDYVWKPIDDIVLPVDEAYLLEKKEEQKNIE